MTVESMRYEDGEILGLDVDGSLLQWNGDDGVAYTASETPEMFGLENMEPFELERIFHGARPWEPPRDGVDSMLPWAFTDLIRLSMKPGRIPAEIPAHYVEYVRTIHRSARGRSEVWCGFGGAIRPGLILLPGAAVAHTVRS